MRRVVMSEAKYEAAKRRLEARAGTRVSDRDVARAVGVSRQTLDFWRRGHSTPRSRHMAKLCDYLDTELDGLFDIAV